MRSILCGLLLLGGAARADDSFLVRTRAVISGASASSDPDGYKLLSGIAVEGGVAWSFHRLFALEFDLRTESREADLTPAGGSQTALGSVELLPVNLFVQFRPSYGIWHPYAGAGANFTVAWEKTGAFDDTRVTPEFGPAAQLGVDVDLGRSLVLNLDARWNVYRPEVIRHGARVALFTVDPITLGAGIGIRL